MVKKSIRSVFVIIIVIFIVSLLVFVFDLKSKPEFEGEKEFVIEKGETLGEISQALLDEGLIGSKTSFEIYIRFKGLGSSVQAGSYVLTAMDIPELARTLVAGKVDNERMFKVIEGWSIDEIAESLVEQGMVSSDDVFLAALNKTDYVSDYSILEQIRGDSLEGFLFPDTYRVYKDATADEIVSKMLENFEQKLTSAMLTEITAKGRSLYDVIIMASIIEAEVPGGEDRNVVSGILWKRFDSGMALQVDSSLKYVIGKKNRASLTFDELNIDSLYNTYKYMGLPPTPIGNPGESAIRAAIYPRSSDYWFYLSDKEGNTRFGKDLSEHNANIQKYLK